MRPFEVRRAENPQPIVVSIPHAGLWLPRGYRERLTPDMRGLPMTDWHLPTLFDFLPRLGVTVIAALVSRYVIDLNRPPSGESLYGGRFETGLVPTQSFTGDQVFTDEPSEIEIDTARREVYQPYHSMLDALLEECQWGGKVAFLDLHSVTPASTRISPGLPAAIMLGTRDGRSCSQGYLEHVRTAYEKSQYSVVVNNPYKGGWITERIGRQSGVEAIQIEMDWSVYMDPMHPRTAKSGERFRLARDRLFDVWSDLVPGVCAYLA